MRYFLIAVFSLLSVKSLAIDDVKPFIEFLQATAKVTAVAEAPFPNAVKFMAFGKNEAGEVVVAKIWVGDDHWTKNEVKKNIKAIAHFHNSEMDSKPEEADFDYPNCSRLYCFVVSNDGGKIWEISINTDGKKYRDVTSTNYGGWQNDQY
tara:strand:- start:673 stop:1122 length:450 start_codon:yes stop_codon:yes gene_type:complete